MSPVDVSFFHPRPHPFEPSFAVAGASSAVLDVMAAASAASTDDDDFDYHDATMDDVEPEPRKFGTTSQRRVRPESADGADEDGENGRKV